jgi:hypothetical protein
MYKQFKNSFQNLDEGYSSVRNDCLSVVPMVMKTFFVLMTVWCVHTFATRDKMFLSFYIPAMNNAQNLSEIEVLQ